MTVTDIRTKLLDASHNFRGKSKDSILKNSLYDRKMLVDTVFSLISIADNLLQLSNSDELQLKKLADEFTLKTETMIRKLIEETSTLNPLKKDNPEPVKHVLLVDNDGENGIFSADSWSDVVKRKISKKLKDVPVNKTVLNKDGKGCIFLPDEPALIEATKILSSEYSVTKSTKTPVVLLPKLKINNLNTEEINTPEVLKEKILHKNPSIKEKLNCDRESQLEVLFVDKKKNNAVMKVTPDIRELIMKNRRIFIDLESHHISDSFHVEQCFQCQAFGHRSTSDRCPKKNSDAVCLFCAGSHRSANCNHKNNKNKHRCANCSNSDIRDLKNCANTHNASSRSCPLYEKEIEQIKKKTCYDSKN